MMSWMKALNYINKELYKLYKYKKNCVNHGIMHSYSSRIQV